MKTLQVLMLFLRKIPKSSKNFRFKPILPQDVMKAIQKQKNSNSGNIPTRFLKAAAPCVSTSLSIIFSKSLNFQNLWRKVNTRIILNLQESVQFTKEKALNQTLTITGLFQFYLLWPGYLKNWYINSFFPTLKAYF